MQKWLLQTLSEVLSQYELAEGQYEQSLGKNTRTHQQWMVARSALEQLLLQVATSEVGGFVLASPVPVFSHPALISRFPSGIFTKRATNALALMPCQSKDEPIEVNTTTELPLLPTDPLGNEQFCLIFTRQFSLVMVLEDGEESQSNFQFSFDPEVVQEAWETLRPRVLLANPHYLTELDVLAQEFAPITPDYRLVMQFSRQLLNHLPEESSYKHREESTKKEPNSTLHSEPEVELLQALTHEVRTPLTTIRTMTRLLLKRRDLTPDVTRRLEIIDRECTEQINRMELIFRASELVACEDKQAPVNLTPMSLNQVLQQSIPRWQKQAARRDLTLDVVLPKSLPTVVSNPAMLDQVLTGLIENFTRTLPAGGHIQVQVSPAGNQLKLQLLSQQNQNEPESHVASFPHFPTTKSIGQLLRFQPETGCISLNLNVTKDLFQAMGGKLIVRQRPQQGEVLTIFLPLEVASRKVQEV